MDHSAAPAVYLYGRYREQLEYTLIPVFLHWADLQAPGEALAAIYITLRRYLPTPPRRV